MEEIIHKRSFSRNLVLWSVGPKIKNLAELIFTLEDLKLEV